MPIPIFLHTGISRRESVPQRARLLAQRLVTVLCPLAVTAVAAQAPPSGSKSSSAVFFEQTSRAIHQRPFAWNDTLALRPSSNYHREGATIGAAVGSIALAIIGNGLCQDSDARSKNCTGTTLGSAFLGAAVGFTLGLLIGGQIPKPEEVDSTAVQSP